MSEPQLSLIEGRIIGVLLEKQRTVADTYPLSLSALTTGCNQKTARDPVLNLSEAEVLAALNELTSRDWVIETSGSRVLRYEHNAERKLKLPALSVVLLGVLLLRGPQTAAELRANAERWYRFADVSSVEGFLNELAERPLVSRLPKQPGSREHRWAQLLTGAPPIADTELAAPQAGSSDALSQRVGALEARLDSLTDQLRELTESLAALRQSAGHGPGSS